MRPEIRIALGPVLSLRDKTRALPARLGPATLGKIALPGVAGPARAFRAVTKCAHASRAPGAGNARQLIPRGPYTHVFWYIDMFKF